MSAAAAATQLGADADFDKAMLARLTAENGRLRITLRELDLATVQLSPPVTVSCANLAALPSALADAVIAAFSPLATLQAAEGDHVEARLRAASLIVATEHPTLAKQGTPLIPVLRPLDRLGRAKPELVSAIPWTVLEAETVNDGRLQCRIHSAHRKPLAGRPSQRIKRYAIAPAGPAWLARGTTLSLASVDAPNGPLVGYDIIEGNPEDDKTPVTVVGRTDGRGQVDVAASEAAWRMLYVRHGERLLARLPLIVGWRQEVTVPLASDDKRLEAEAFVTALRQDVIDTVARRQILAARIRRRIAEEKFDEAAELLRSMTQLTPFYEFDRRLQAAKATMASDQPRTQQLIDELFTKTESVLRRYLDPEDVARLQSQLAQARSGSQ
ncbi:MAG: hypothetical protein KDA41_21330 [Planctomycetales bacterium]|nr:hypothetical protein [Planctomycetales bacterium]